MFGYPVLNSIDFDDFTFPFTPWLLLRLRRYIKHSRQCFIGYPNTSNFVKNTPLRVVFSTLFSVFGHPDETLSLVNDELETFWLNLFKVRKPWCGSFKTYCLYMVYWSGLLGQDGWILVKFIFLRLSKEMQKRRPLSSNLEQTTEMWNYQKNTILLVRQTGESREGQDSPILLHGSQSQRKFMHLVRSQG